MKKKLRVLALVLAVALISSVTTGATLAWFTAKAESKLNVITTGNIAIDLTEEVGVIGEGGVAKENTDGAEYIEVMPGDYLKKEVKVANTGSNPAYIAVTVDVNNYDKINAVIEHFGNGQDNDDAEAVLDSVFDGWGLTVKNRYLPDGTKDMSYKMGELVDNHILHVDAAKMINTQETNHFSLENWFKSDAEKAAAGYTVVGTKGFYHGGMENYSLRYTYYIYLESDEEVVLFKGLNIPSYFNNDQIEMFDGLEIEVNASAIQADNMGIHPDYGTKEMTAFAILNGSIEPEDVVVDNTPERIEINSNSGDELKNAIANAKDGDVIVLNEDVLVAGYTGDKKLIVDKAIVLDLNGKTITTECGWGGIDVKNGASIKNGTIKHTSNTAAIKAFEAKSIENVTIEVATKDTNKVVTGIAVQAGYSVENISNVTITGASQGIEVLKGASVGTIENVNVTAVSNGSAPGIALQINAGNVGKVVNSTFNGETYGVHMMLNGEYTVACELENCDVTGGTASVYAHDEVGIANTNNCSLTLTYDAATELNGAFVWDFEDECLSVVTLNKP